MFAGVGACNVLHLLIASVLPPAQRALSKETDRELEMDAVPADVAEQVVTETPGKAQPEPEVEAEDGQTESKTEDRAQPEAEVEAAAQLELPVQDAVPADVAGEVITEALDEAHN